MNIGDTCLVSGVHWEPQFKYAGQVGTVTDWIPTDHLASLYQFEVTFEDGSREYFLLNELEEIRA